MLSKLQSSVEQEECTWRHKFESAEDKAAEVILKYRICAKNLNNMVYIFGFWIFGICYVLVLTVVDQNVPNIAFTLFWP